MSARATQLRYAEAGKCQQCGAAKPASATLCGGCLAAHNSTTRALKERLLAKRKCVWCGKRNRSGFRACDACRERYNAARRGRKRAA